MNKINKLAGVIIWTQNFDAMYDFYTQKLGLVPHTLKKQSVNFHWDNLKFTIAFHQKVRSFSKDKYRIMLNFEVDNIDSMYKLFFSKDVEFIRKPSDEKWGKVASFLDPDQNIIQIIQNYKK